MARNGREERFHRLAYVNVEAFWDPLRSNRRYADLPRRIGQLSSFSTAPMHSGPR